jgi:hypothetical protein
MNLEIEECSSFLLGERKAEVTFGNSKIKTPSPIITNTDINYANTIIRNSGIDIFFKNQILEIRELLWPQKVKDVILNPKGQKSHTDWINRQISNAKLSSNISVSLYTPTFVKVTVDKNLINELVKIQSNSNLTIVNIPDPTWLSNEKSMEVVKEKSSLIVKKKKEPFYLIPMSQDYGRFAQKVEECKQYVAGVTATYADPNDYAPNFKVLAALRSNPKIIRILSNVEKTYLSEDSSHSDTIAFYPISFLVSEFYSIKYGGFGSGERDADKERSYATRIDSGSLEFMTIQKHRENYKESLKCECHVDIGKVMGDLLADYYGNLTEAFRIHDSIKIYEFNQILLDSYQVGKTFEFVKDDKRLIDLLNKTYLSDSMKKQQMLPVEN